MAVDRFTTDSRGLIMAGSGSSNSSSVAIISSSLRAVDIHNNGAVVQLGSNNRVDDGWSRANNVFKYSGETNYVEIVININAVDSGSSNYWSRPKLRVLKDGDILGVIDDLVMQQNGAYDGDATYADILIDEIISTDPVYTFEWFDKETRTSTLVPEDYSKIVLKAFS